MGLTIHYELSLPGTMDDAVVLQLLERLRTHAATLGVESLTDICTLSGAQLCDDRDDMDVWTLERMIHIVAECVRNEQDDDREPVDRAAAVGAAAFLINPGEGCESALFGVVRPRAGVIPNDTERPDAARRWCWQSFCKTQYAASVSPAHFVRCHLIVIQMLEEAERLGFTVTVQDEGQYWETRSTERLLAEVTHAQRIMARFAGALHDANPELDLQAPIFEDPNFERLESEPLRPRPDE